MWIVSAAAAQADTPDPTRGMILGTATDSNGGAIPGAKVILEGADPKDERIVGTTDTGFFKFAELEPGAPFHIKISAEGFADWTSPEILLKPGQCLILTGSQLRVAEHLTTVDVRYTSEEIATEQIKQEEQQRVFGIIPNFYVSYNKNAEPLTTKLKFQLAFKVAHDPVTAIAVLSYSGIQQAGDVPNYQQGAKGYGQRVGANAAGAFADIMMGGAILPSLLHQDPRYFYQGTGSNKSRLMHALSNPFVARGDNGHKQLNYSSIGGDLFASALDNAYCPSSNRGYGMFLGNFLISTGERMLSSVAQEFIIGKFTKHKAEE